MEEPGGAYNHRKCMWKCIWRLQCYGLSAGELFWIGIGAVVGNNISICDDCMIGAGAVVVKDIEKAGTYVGVPAKRIK